MLLSYWLRYSLSSLFYKMQWILCALWLVVAYDLLEYRHGWRHGKIVFFVLSNMARGFENVCEIISNWASEGLEKSSAGAVYKQEKEETKAKVFLSIWNCLKQNCLKQISKADVINMATKRHTQFWKYLLDYSALSKRRPRKKVRGSSCLQVR